MRHITPALALLTVFALARPAGAAEPPRAGGAGIHWNQAFMGHMPAAESVETPAPEPGPSAAP